MPVKYIPGALACQAPRSAGALSKIDIPGRWTTSDSLTFDPGERIIPLRGFLAFGASGWWKMTKKWKLGLWPLVLAAGLAAVLAPVLFRASPAGAG